MPEETARMSAELSFDAIKESARVSAGKYKDDLQKNPGGLQSTSSLTGGSEMDYFRNQSALVEEIAGKPGEPKIELSESELANQLVTSIFNGDVEKMAHLLIQEKKLSEGNEEFSDKTRRLIGGIIRRFPLSDESKKSIERVLNNLRSFVKHQLPDPNTTDRSAEVVKPDETIVGQAKYSENGYITYRGSDNVKSESINGIDTISVDNVLIFCSPSHDCMEANANGEDAAGIVVTDTGVLLVEADGVSQSFMGEYAARRSVQSIIELGGGDLKQNLQMSARRLVGEHASIPIPENVPSFLKPVLQEKKDKAGTQTMLNQIFIDNSGKVSGLFLGDGGFSVLRTSGERLDFDCGGKNSRSRLSSKEGVQGESVDLNDVADNLVLSSGDILILYSDGIQKVRLDEISVALRGSDTTQKILDSFLRPDRTSEIDDDKTLLVYRKK